MVAIYQINSGNFNAMVKTHGDSSIRVLPHNTEDRQVECVVTPLTLLSPDLCSKLGVEFKVKPIVTYLVENKAAFEGISYFYSVITSLTNNTYDWGNSVQTILDSMETGTTDPWEVIYNLYCQNNTSPTGWYLFQPDDVPDEASDVINFKISFDSGFYLDAEVASTSTEPVGSTDWTKKHSYSFKMDSARYNFFRTTRQGDELFFGLELELSTQLSCQEMQAIVTDIEPKQEPFFIFKDDSSVSGSYSNKVELVTVPATPKYLRVELKKFFDKLTMLADKKGVDLKDYFDMSEELNNGVHIHISRDSFSGGTRGTHIKRFSTLMNLNDRFSRALFNKVAKRPDLDGQYCKVSDHNTGRLTSWRLKNCMRDQARGRLNVSGGPTVEIRMFQGIFNLTHILECIDFAEATVDYSEMCAISSLSLRFAEHFKEFILKSGQYRALRKAIV